MKKIFFFSDVHFGLEDSESEKAKERKVLSFLDHVQANGNQLFILGDLFDYWFEYRSVIPRGFHNILSRLDQIVRSGIRVHYVAGNHDFWLKDFFSKDLGISIYKDPFPMDLHGKKFFFHHGDGLATNDTGYRILKKILRNKLSIFMFSLLHPDISSPLAKGSSRSSRKYTGSKDYGETDGMMKFAQSKMTEGFDYVIMGHRHVPCEVSFEKGTYINLGDWITHCTYAEFDGSIVQLKTWK